MVSWALDCCFCGFGIAYDLVCLLFVLGLLCGGVVVVVS